MNIHIVRTQLIRNLTKELRFVGQGRLDNENWFWSYHGWLKDCEWQIHEGRSKLNKTEHVSFAGGPGKCLHRHQLLNSIDNFLNELE